MAKKKPPSRLLPEFGKHIMYVDANPADDKQLRQSFANVPNNNSYMHQMIF